MRMLFDADLSVERLIPALSIESGTRITPEDTLVIFDEVQEVPRAMTSLKMFNEAAPEYDVLATGSALGIAMHPGFPDVYLEVQHPCWSCNSNSSSANASAGVR